MRKNNLLSAILFFLLVVIIFPFIFSSNAINGGDYTPTTNVIQILSANFYGWCGYRDLGFNCIAINLHYNVFWIGIYFLSQLLHLPQFISERIFWWYPFFIVGFLSSFLLVKKVFPKSQFSFLAPIVYIFNTYVLMVLGGGQISGIGLGYSAIPLVLLFWINLFEKKTLFRSVMWAVAISVLTGIDPRMGFIGCMLCFLYECIYFFYFRKFRSLSIKNSLFTLLFLFFIPFSIIIALHMFWILPTIIYRQNPLHDLGPAYDSVGALKFFSFATFENALSLLHPNWPENVFGLTHFMKPEFLLIPLVSFSSLLFLKKEKNGSFFIVFFTFIAVLGAFFSKGANDPFGNSYAFLFEKVPGFSLFRDSTKWYVFVSLAYSMLVPFVLSKIYESVATGSFIKKLSGKWIIAGISLIYFLFLILPAVQGRLSGAFHSSPTPKEYENYQSFLKKDASFFRTLWVPTPSRYGQYDIYHPTIDASNFLDASESGVLVNFQDPHFENVVEEAGVRYVIVPDDTNHEIFIADRKYNDNLRTHAIAILETIPWLKKEKGFGGIVLFSVKSPKSHIWLESGQGGVVSEEIDSNTYRVSVSNVKKNQKLIFSESYNKGWVAKDNFLTLLSEPYDTYFTSFVLPKSGDYTLTIRFAPQDLVEKGLWVSGIAFLSILVYLVWFGVSNMLK